MNTHTMLLHEELTKQILAAFYEVYNELGYGFSECVYQNSLYFELQDRGYDVVAQQQCTVHYKKRNIGDYFTDLTVNNLVILELKACETIVEGHKTQLRNYLRATTLEVGLVLNFGPEPQFSRRIFTNDKKKLPKKE